MAFETLSKMGEPAPCHGSSLPALEVVAVSKEYPGVTALRDVSLRLGSGEVHGLVGANGAGKSTLIKVITGAVRPDAGTVRIGGHELGSRTLQARLASGVAAIYQELAIVPQMTAAQNVFLGRPPRRGLLVDRRAMRRTFEALAARVGAHEVPFNAVAGTLSVANQQLLEVMRALVREHVVLIMDEPTAALGNVECDRLLTIVRGLRDHGVTVIYISHDLGEVLSIADRVSVMRDGALVSTRKAGEWNTRDLVEDMLGTRNGAGSTERGLLPLGSSGAASRAYESSPGTTRNQGRRAMQTGLGSEVLRVANVNAGGVVRDFEMCVHPGEIVGLAGLIGSGRTELLRALAGADRHASGRIWVNGCEQKWPKTVRAALRNGLALVPEERRTQGLIPLMSGVANVTLTDTRPYRRLGWIRTSRQRRCAERAADPVGFAAARLKTSVSTLSGGNQQKLVVGKWLHRGPRVLLLDEPTRGIDVGAKSEIYGLVRRLAVGGLAVVVVSSELEEVVHLSDRLIVMHHGRTLGALEKRDASVANILRMIYATDATDGLSEGTDA